jgi:hypothetical protein
MAPMNKGKRTSLIAYETRRSGLLQEWACLQLVIRRRSVTFRYLLFIGFIDRISYCTTGLT